MSTRQRVFPQRWVAMGSCLGVCIGLLCCSLAFGQTGTTDSSQPIVITGDSLEIDSAQKIATYTGNVKVVQGDMSMFSDTLVIYLDETGKQLRKAVATGNVRMVNETITATGEEGIFYNDEQKLEIIKKAKIWQENNTITAHRIVAYLQDEIIEGYSHPDTERATMTVYSEGGVQMPTLGATPQPSPTPDPAAAEDDEEASPIVIVADQLTLNNPEQLATYTGDVEATQEATQIFSDEMYVY
ncbi:lipopolysaccharide transport periplasmic protein LptA, partial [candidate division KSB3 bacterium]|nr:lipopolysaccharide transport periplasmic protein LptA [candidate division KSB3 bacterium]MBD3326641.1 lipopolysaccharide transport periplasmic protein LptA [candidate division KSB3 bacterium]